MAIEGVLLIEPKPAPRPKVRRAGGVYYPSGYTQYKADLISQLLAQKNTETEQAELANFRAIELTFFFAYPKSTAKKKRVDMCPCFSKGDLDNLAKGVLDAMEQAGIIANDRQIAHLDVAKYWTTGSSRIHYYLAETFMTDSDE